MNSKVTNRDIEKERHDSDDEGNFLDDLVTTVRQHPVASLAIGAALFALARTPAGRVIKPAISLAVSSGAATALASATIRQFSKK